MNKVTKKVRKGLMARYRQAAPVIPLSLRDQPVRTQYKGLQRQKQDPPFLPSPELMNAGQNQQPVDPVQALMDQVSGMIPTDPFGAALGAQGTPQDMMGGMGGGGGPMMAPEGAPPGMAPSGQVTAQEGPGIDPQQVLASLFG